VSKGMQIESFFEKGVTRPVIAIPEYIVHALGESELPIGETLISFEGYIMSIIGARVAKGTKEQALTFTISKTYRVPSAVNNKPIKLRLKACFVSRGYLTNYTNPNLNGLPNFSLHNISIKALELSVIRHKTFADLKHAVLTSAIEKMIATNL